MQIKIVNVQPTHRSVVALIEQLNQYQISLYGMESCNLESPESLAENAFMLGAYAEEKLAGIGAIKLFSDYAEIKRMYVDESFRGHSIAAKTLNNLEQYAVSKGIYKVCLETGCKHEEAIRFYEKNGYSRIDSFGTYMPNDVSIYYQKTIGTKSFDPKVHG